MDLKTTVGIIGGGQLARMLLLAASKIGVNPIVMCENPDSIADVIDAERIVSGDVFCEDDLVKFCEKCTSIIVETEHFNISALESAQRTLAFNVFPQVEILKMISDKLNQKLALQKIGVPVTPCISLNGSSFKPLVVKRRRLGYDGKGVWVINDHESLSGWFDNMPVTFNEVIGTSYTEDYLLEEKIDIQAELAVTVFRAGDEVGHYTCVESLQDQAMCRTVIAPARVPYSVREKACKLAEEVAEKLSLQGLMCIEMFYTKQSELMVNEIAPRVHNTGHYTIEACSTSQFEQCIRIAAGILPGCPDMIVKNAFMLNIVSDSESKKEDLHNEVHYAIQRIPNARLSLYSKSPKSGRKLGHFTITGNSFYELSTTLKVMLPRIKFLEPFILPEPLDDGIFSYGYEVAVIMGSDSDARVMDKATEILNEFDISHKVSVVSAHRSPRRLYEFAEKAEGCGYKVIIAGAGGAAHLPGMVAALTTLPVIGVPIAQKNLAGADSLYSIIQMPAGVPVATVAIDNSANAAILAARIIALNNPECAKKLKAYASKLDEYALGQAMKFM